jgi:Cu/Ag efflux protein CusF
MLFLIRCAPLALVLAAAQLHAQGMNMPRERHSAAATPAPLVKAEVRSIDPLKRTVTLNHEDIPNVGMSAMTMAFDVADKKMLKGIRLDPLSPALKASLWSPSSSAALKRCAVRGAGRAASTMFVPPPAKRRFS